jgi:hypothetical protein
MLKKKTNVVRSTKARIEGSMFNRFTTRALDSLGQFRNPIREKPSQPGSTCVHFSRNSMESMNYPGFYNTHLATHLTNGRAN